MGMLPVVPSKEDTTTFYKFYLCCTYKDSISAILHSIQCNNNNDNNFCKTSLIYFLK